jgi:ribosome-associated protein
MRRPDDEGPTDETTVDGRDRPSKTQRKRQMHELQHLGEQLVALPSNQLARIELPEALREQIELARRITAREALRRQLQYVGRLMRGVDADAIRAALANVRGRPGVAS